MKSVVLTKWMVDVPAGAKVLVKDGERVEYGQMIAKFREVEEVTDSSPATANWGVGEKELWLERWVGKEVKAGEELRKGRGLFGVRKSLVARETALIRGIDEFGNLVYEIKGKEVEVISPVDGLIRLPEKGRVVVEFRAVKFEGEGRGVDKSWGQAGRQAVVERLADVSVDFEGRIVLVSRLDELMSLKMEAVGVAGIVAKEVAEEVETDMPILKVSPRDWVKLNEEFSKNKVFRCLLNAGAGRLLVVESKSK